MKKFLVTLVITLTLAFGLVGRVFAYDIPSMPDNGIYDPMGLLSAETIAAIEEQNALAAQTDLKPQVAVVVIDSLKGETVESVANQFATTWQVGFPDTKAGTLLLLAIDDREYRFELSDNASQYLTEGKAEDIGEKTKDYLRAADYDAAVRQMTTEMFIELRGDAFSHSQPKEERLTDSVQPHYQWKNDHRRTSDYTQSPISDHGAINTILLILFPFLGIFTAIGGKGTGRTMRRTRKSFSTKSRSSNSSRIGRGGGGFSGRGSSGKW